MLIFYNLNTFLDARNKTLPSLKSLKNSCKDLIFGNLRTRPAKKFQNQLLLLEVGYFDDRHISIEKFPIWKLAELNWFINIFLGLSDSQIIILYKNCGLVFHNCTLLIFWGHNKWMSWGMKINDDSIHYLSPNQSREQTIDDGIMLTNTENAFLKIIVCDYIRLIRGKTFSIILAICSELTIRKKFVVITVNFSPLRRVKYIFF